MDLEEFFGNKNITYIWTILFLPRNQSSLWHSCPFQYGQFDIYFIICIFRNSPFFLSLNHPLDLINPPHTRQELRDRIFIFLKNKFTDSVFFIFFFYSLIFTYLLIIFSLSNLLKVFIKSICLRFSTL